MNDSEFHYESVIICVRELVSHLFKCVFNDAVIFQDYVASVIDE
jgi:hypothetical protein